ncbi:MAG: hypothetical protein ACUVUG_09360 [Candidatus Aminicenantia bacterium]
MQEIQNATLKVSQEIVEKYEKLNSFPKLAENYVLYYVLFGWRIKIGG